MSSTEEKLDRIVESIQEVNVNLETLRVSLSSLTEMAEDHEKRVRTLERWQHRLTPVLSAITFALGAVLTFALRQFL